MQAKYNTTRLRARLCRLLLSTLLCLYPGMFCHGVEWSINEIHLQYGVLDVPSFAGGGDAKHLIYTLQHASEWKYGDNFLFIDLLDARGKGFQHNDVYGEAYANLSFTKLRGRAFRDGPITDIGFFFGINAGADTKIRKYAPGIRLALSLPGFTFANLDFMSHIDDSQGVTSGGAPKEDNAFIIDFNFARPFTLGEAQFSLEGHLEYAKGRDNEFGDRQASWILFQPQLRWRAHEHFSLGVEFQYWRNKLGDPFTDEKTAQALLVWNF